MTRSAEAAAKVRPFEIGDHVIAPGTRQIVDLPVSLMADHTPVTMSVQVIHGRRPGPSMFVSAGVHGDEIIGVEIIRRLLRAPNLKTMRGTLLAVPVVNAFGFFNRSRYLPDRRDLNRVFPGTENGSLAGRLANLFTHEILERTDIGIDLHSAAVHRTNLPQTRVSPGNELARQMAEIFGAPVILESPLREGSMRAAAEDRGRTVLLYEAGEGLRFDETSVRAGVSGILRIMAQQGMISSKGISKAKAPSQFCASSKWMRAPAGGLLRTYAAEGDVVNVGDLLAIVSDPFGRTDVELLAAQSGVIVGRAVMPIVNEGDALFHVATLASHSDGEEALGELADQLAGDPLFDEDEII